MFDTLTASDAMTARAVVADPSAPKPLRESVGAALELYARAAELRDAHRSALRVARAEWQAADTAELVDVVGALEAGETPTVDTLGVRVREALTRVSDLEAGRPFADQAVRRFITRVRSGVYRDNREAVVKWCASVRAAVPWWESVPEHVAYAWSSVGPVWVTYPGEACALQRPNGETVNLPNRARLTITSPSEREVWVWSSLVAGGAVWRDANEVRPTGWWHDRDALPRRPDPVTADRRRTPVFARSR